VIKRQVRGEERALTFQAPMRSLLVFALLSFLSFCSLSSSGSLTLVVAPLASFRSFMSAAISATSLGLSWTTVGGLLSISELDGGDGKERRSGDPAIRRRTSFWTPISPFFLNFFSFHLPLQRHPVTSSGSLTSPSTSTEDPPSSTRAESGVTGERSRGVALVKEGLSKILTVRGSSRCHKLSP